MPRVIKPRKHVIDPQKEKLILVKDSPPHFPGKRPCCESVSRWAKEGINGVVLSSIVIGRARYITAESIAAFIEEQNQQEAVPC